MHIIFYLILLNITLEYILHYYTTTLNYFYTLQPGMIFNIWLEEKNC